MTDLISRQAAIDAILYNQEVYSNHFGDDPIDKYTIAIIDNDAQTIAQLPTIDPVKHGRWELHEYPDGYYHTECSECGEVYDEKVYFEKTAHYCPNCGARMNE